MRLIDADVLTERLNNAIECGRRVDMPTLELEAVLANVQNAPSIDIEPKRGEWIIHFDDLFPEESSIECSVCHEEQPLGIDDNYCPNCGADMRERKESE